MLRIKRFISQHRKPLVLDSSRNSFEDLRFTDTKLSTNSSKGLSWQSQPPSFENLPLRRANSEATVRTSQFPTASTTAHSSATSLCSCDCAAKAASIEAPLSKESATSKYREILYLPPLSPSNASSDAQTRRLMFSESPSRSSASSISKSRREEQSTATIAAGSTFDLIGALALEIPGEVEHPTESFKHTNDPEMEDFSDNVEQLIRETDAAFEAVGNALADAKAATRGWYDDDTPPVARNTSLTRGILRKNPRLSVQAPRSTSIAKRKKPAKRNLLGRALRSTPKPAEKTPPRWTLNDVTTNVVDVFSGKIFRTEVDEMLTPDRLQQLQETLRLSQEHRISTDSIRGAETDEGTPTEPFHLQSLSNRLDALQKTDPPFPSPILPPPAPPQLTSQPPSRPARPAKPKRPLKVQFAAGAKEEMTVSSLTFPTPPRIIRRPSASGSVPHLPTIPEVSPMTLSPISHFTTIPSLLSSPSKPESITTWIPEETSNENFIHLPSTPYTLTSPLFLHGPIRIPLPLSHHSPLTSPSTSSEPLDWTAFQMAISGTGGIDGFTSTYALIQQEKMDFEEIEREADSLNGWWAEFGFQGWGRMVGDESLLVNGGKQNALMRRKRREDIERATFLSSQSQFQSQSQSSPRHAQHLKHIIDTEKIAVSREGDGNGDGDGDEEEREAESLPPSPMLELVLPASPNRDEVIPMGFNLGHDLGDFLRWEGKYVKAFVDD